MYNFNDYLKHHSSKKLLHSHSVLPKLRKTPVLAFIFDADTDGDDNVLIGFVNKRGELFKLRCPIKLSNKQLTYVPVLNTLSTQDHALLQRLIKHNRERVTVIETELHDEIQKRLKKLMSRKKKLHYMIYYDLYFSKIMIVSKKHNEKFNDLHSKFENDKLNQSKIRSMLLHNRYEIIGNIEKHRENFKRFLLTKTENNKAIIKQQILFNKEKELAQKYLQQILDNTIEHKKWVNKTIYFPNKQEYLHQKDKQISQISEIIKKINEELEKSVEFFTSAQSEKADLLKDIAAKDTLISEFLSIKSKIISYYNQWLEWFKNNPLDQNDDTLIKHKKLLIKEVTVIKNRFNQLVELVNRNDLIITDPHQKIQLQQNISDIELIIQKFLTEQFTEISKEQAKTIEKRQQILYQLEKTLKRYIVSIKNMIIESESVLKLSQDKMPNIKEEDLYNYQDCFENLKQFISVNNTFVRIKKTMSLLDKIVDTLTIKKLQFEDTEFDLINDNDKQKIISSLEHVKETFNNILQKIDLTEIHEHQNYKNIISEPSKIGELTIGLCTLLSNKTLNFINFTHDLQYLFSKIKELQHFFENISLNEAIINEYNKTPNMKFTEQLFLKTK